MKLDRLLGIITVLLQKDRVTAPELAKKFEVNRRTIGRDIDALCLAGIPVVTRQGTGGGISIAEGFKLDKSVLTAEELSGIIAALKGIGSITEKTQIERTLEKLNANGSGRAGVSQSAGQSNRAVSLREPIIIDLASHYKGQLTEKIETIKRAVIETRLIEFDYFYEKGDSHRRIEPYFVIFQWSSWYVFGFCLERRDWRMFKLLRLWNLKLCVENYNARAIPQKQRDFNAQFTDDIKLVAVFEPSEKYKLIESYGLNCYTETDEGLRMEIGFTNRDFLVNWLLGFGGRVKVLEPDCIADEIKIEAKKILSRYK
ncbi:MAG: YafY family transcriptional regulator [Defluviitaleaceae bacterium]|nr:YafY family transcriptional regulator [Defluviitaleaceae bacterium]